MNTGSWLRRALRALHRREKGQTLVLAAFSMVVVLGVGALVIDIGSFMHGHQKVENAVDAAALAAAHDLPVQGSSQGSTAVADANGYLTNNDPELQGRGSVTFRCIIGQDPQHADRPRTSDIPAVCDPGSHSYNCNTGNGTCVYQCDPSQGNKCNTVVVGASKDVPFFLAPVLNIFHDSTGTIRAAACRGACGGPPTVPLDIVIIIDRTRSMSSSDVTNARNAAKAALGYFDPSLQHVALGVLPQSQAGDRCSSVLNGDMDHPDVGNWVPVGLSADYQNPDKTLKTSSVLVSTINCLEQAPDSNDDPVYVCDQYDRHGHCTDGHWDYPGHRQTNIGDAVRKAKEYLQANGRTGVKQGIILLTDGEANRPSWELPCLYAYNQAAAAKAGANGIEIFTIGYGLGDVKCEPPPSGYEPSGDYMNKYVTKLLADMATESADDHDGSDYGTGGCSNTTEINAENGDGDHFLCEAKGTALAPLFQQAAEVLASGARLIQVPPD